VLPESVEFSWVKRQRIFEIEVLIKPAGHTTIISHKKAWCRLYSTQSVRTYVNLRHAFDRHHFKRSRDVITIDSSFFYILHWFLKTLRNVNVAVIVIVLMRRH
jgi:hypothetical protein